MKTLSTPPRINPFADEVFVLVFLTMLINATMGEPFWQHVTSLFTSRPGVTELLHGTSGLILFGLVFWRGMGLKRRSVARVP